jgi:hypothetical protein
MPRKHIALDIVEFVRAPAVAGSASEEVEGIELKAELHASPKPEFWAYYGDYDWVVLCQLFGTMMDLPKGWPMMCMDLKQLAVHLGCSMLPPQYMTDFNPEHHALNDARWTKYAHDWVYEWSQQHG